MIDEGGQMFGFDGGGLGNLVVFEVLAQLDDITSIGDGGGRGAFLGFEVIDELLQGGFEANRVG